MARLLTAAMSRRREDDKPQVAIDVTLEPSSSSSGPGGRGSSSLRQSLEDYCRRRGVYSCPGPGGTDDT